MDVRLAYNPGPVNAYGALAPMNPPSKTEAPAVRLALLSSDRTNDVLTDVGNAIAAEAAPSVRLAATTASMQCAETSGVHRYPHLKEPGDGQEPLKPALLVSYVYLAPFLKSRHKYAYRDWVLDSGAFSAHNSGKVIKLQDYIDTCKELLASDPTLTEVFALDVIGDWRASHKNTLEMWRQGVPAIPTFHPGKEPWEVLKGMAKDFPKIALGGVVGMVKKQKEKLIEQCFARVWPCRIHGLGMSGEDMVMKYPFHSVDATNWEIGPCAFGNWKTFGNMSIRGSKQNLRCEVEWHLKLERTARQRWAKTWQQVGPQLKDWHTSPLDNPENNQHNDATDGTTSPGTS